MKRQAACLSETVGFSKFGLFEALCVFFLKFVGLVFPFFVFIALARFSKSSRYGSDRVPLKMTFVNGRNTERLPSWTLCFSHVLPDFVQEFQIFIGYRQ